MAVSIVQGAVGSVGASTSQHLPFVSPATKDNLIVLTFFTVDNGTAGIGSVQFNAVNAPAAFLDQTIGSTTIRIWWAEGDEQYVTVTPVSPPLTEWAVAVFEIGDEAHIPPYDINDRTGVAGTPATRDPWISEDTGIVVGTLAAEEATSIVEPAGWTLLGALMGSGLSVGLATRTITAGVQPGEDWGAGVGAGIAWETLTAPFYDVTTRLGAAFAEASGPGGQHPTAGHTPNPGSTTPFTPEPEPLPPNPTDIEVPLPPWIPNSGTWREV